MRCCALFFFLCLFGLCGQRKWAYVVSSVQVLSSLASLILHVFHFASAVQCEMTAFQFSRVFSAVSVVADAGSSRWRSRVANSRRGKEGRNVQCGMGIANASVWSSHQRRDQTDRFYMFIGILNRQ